MGKQYDAPNQQVVRADGSGPADEGNGGAPEVEPTDSEVSDDEAPKPTKAAAKKT